MHFGRLPRSLFFVLLLVFCSNAYTVSAQVPTCSGPSAGLIYSISGTGIINYDPALPVTATNPSANTLPAPPAGSNGICVSTNLASLGPSPTFYVVVSGQMRYYNGTVWVNTGHSSGYTGSLPNAAAGGGYIFIHDWTSGDVFRYGGTGAATFLTTIAGYSTGGGAHGIAADCAGNWYALVFGTNGGLKKYSPTGVLLQTWTIAGTVPFGFEGFTMVGGDFYGNNFANNYKGVISGTTITFTTIASTPTASIHNWTACPSGFTSPAIASIDTGYYCGSGPGVPVSVSGTSPFTWSVISGPGVLSFTTGSNITVTTTGTTRIRVEGSSGACGGSGADTVTILVPTATVDAGLPDTALGCGQYRDTLGGTLTGTTPGLTYTIAWTPAASILSGGSTLTPIIEPTSSTTYTLSVFTPAAQGGCLFTDTVRITVKDLSVDAGFNYTIRYGCTGDTVDFFNNSTALAGTLTYRWDFGDGTTDTARNPTHLFTTSGTFAVKLVVTAGPCADSLVASLPLDHPLAAAFTSSLDSFCQGDTVFFTNTTTATTRNGIAPKYFWNFGDGTTDTMKDTKHYYAAGGVYVVTMSVRDFVPCADTARDTIVVDSLPYARILTPDTALCEGAAGLFTAQFLAMGNTGLSWTFGDGTGDVGDSLRVTHGYDQPGIYNVILSATYRRCRDTADTVAINVRPFPALNLGSDTSICPGGEPILLTARLSGGGGIPESTRVVWNTRDTASSILVRHHGPYWARAENNDGCSTADTVEVAKDCYLDIPNSFTPNGDGTNDYFWPRQDLSDGIVGFSMRIYNRWGQKVWETARIDGRGWDGKFNGEDQPTGVFIYMVEAELRNGYREKYQGNVTLLR